LAKAKSRFNINLAVWGVILACVISALGFSERDPVGQWYIPAAVVGAALLLAYLRPPKEHAKSDRQPQS
jgi:hypothetical protein